MILITILSLEATAYCCAVSEVVPACGVEWVGSSTWFRFTGEVGRARGFEGRWLGL